MAVYRLFRNKAFEPETIATMSSAYDDVCRELGLRDRDQLQANAVAKKIIEFAQRGERDPVRLRQSVLAGLSALARLSLLTNRPGNFRRVKDVFWKHRRPWPWNFRHRKA